MRNSNQRHNWQAGDWFAMSYGFEVRTFYVLWATNEVVCFCRPKWLVSSAITYPIKQFLSENPVYIGTGKRKWWTRFITPELACPFRKPKEMKLFNKKNRDPFTPPPAEVAAKTEDEWPEYINGQWMK